MWLLQGNGIQTTNANVMDKIKLYQIYYSEATRAMCKTPHLIDGTNAGKYLENSAIVRTLDKFHEEDYIGILSPRFEEKRVWRHSVNTIEGIYTAIENDGYSADVYSFFGGFQTRNVWTKAEQWQPGILEIANRIFAEFEPTKGIDITELETPIVYQNAFVARREVYADYVQTWLRSLITIMENNFEIAALLMQDAKYKDAKLDKQKMIGTFGKPYYTFHPFVCERFFSTYLALNPEITLKHI